MNATERLREQAGSSHPPAIPDNLGIVCGDGHVFSDGERGRGHQLICFSAGSDWNLPESVLWRWSPSDDRDVPTLCLHAFKNLSDFKPVLNATHVLLSACGGAVALLRLQDMRLCFLGFAGGNTHSATLLPDGNIVSASSTGNFIALFAVPELIPDRPRSGFDADRPVTYELADAHGVVWDQDQRHLWALGYHELRAYSYNFDKTHPSLAVVKTITLPAMAQNGHDLYPVAGEQMLFMTGRGVSIFDVRSHQIHPLSDLNKVKSISLSAPDGILATTRPREQWWTDRVSLFHQDLTPLGYQTNARIYKARWWVPDHFGE